MGAAGVALERRYRRWLRWYPRWYRRDYEEEILGVLLAGAAEGARRPEPAECWELIRGAAGTRLRPRISRSQRSAWVALRLARLAAVVQLAVAVTVLVTVGRLHAAILAQDPAYTATQWRLELTGVVYPLAAECGAGLAALLAVAWAQGRAQRRVRLCAAAGVGVLLLVTTDSLAAGLRHGSAVYARPDLAVGVLLWLVELAALAAAVRADLWPGLRAQAAFRLPVAISRLGRRARGVGGDEAGAS